VKHLQHKDWQQQQERLQPTRAAKAEQANEGNALLQSRFPFLYDLLHSYSHRPYEIHYITNKKKVKIFSSISGVKAQTIYISTKIHGREKMKENKKAVKTEKKESVLADIPLGLSSALARNVSAMRVFAEMPEDKRQSFIEGARAINSKEEMRAYVSGIESTKN
jgi:hypothetical protein